jgi:hypothetical protein
MPSDAATARSPTASDHTNRYLEKTLMSISDFPVGLEMDVSIPRSVLQNEVPITAALGDISVFDPEEAARHAQWGSHQAPHPGYTDTYDGARLGEKK